MSTSQAEFSAIAMIWRPPWMKPRIASVGSSSAQAKRIGCQRSYQGLRRSQNRNPIVAWIQAISRTAS